MQDPQQNTSKPNATTHIKDHTPWPSWMHPRVTGWFNICKSISIIYTLTKEKTKATWSSQQMQKKHVIKLNVHSWWKLSPKWVWRERISNVIKVIYNKPAANIILNGKKLRAFPLKFGTRQFATFSPHLFNTGNPNYKNQTRKRNKRHPNWNGRGRTVIVCRWHDTLYRKP